MKEMIGTDDFDMGRNLGMSTYFYTTFLKALLVACLVAGLFSLKIMRRYRRGHFGTRTSRDAGVAPVVGLVPRLRERGGDAGLRRSGGRELAAARFDALLVTRRSRRSATSTTGTSLCGTSSRRRYYASYF